MREKIANHKIDIAFLILMAAAVIANLFRVPLGNARLDESGYIAMANRILQGDIMLVDEWHVSQLAAILLVPFVALFKLLFGSFEGVVLAFRYIYLLVHLAVSVFSYFIWRDKGKVFAALSALIFFMYTPFGIFALSYNTFGENFLYLAIGLWVNRNEKAWACILTGFLLAGSILCNPYLILIYFAYLVYSLLKPGKKNAKDIKCFLLITCGACILLVVFLWNIIGRTSVGTVIHNVGYILNDPAHSPKTVMDFFGALYDFFAEIKYGTVFVCVLFFAGLLVKQIRFMCFSGMLMAAGVDAVYLGFLRIIGNDFGISTAIVPLSLVGMAAFIYCKKKDFRVFAGFLCALFYAACMLLSSNTGMMSGAIAFAIATPVSLCFIIEYISEQEKKISFIPLLISVVMLLASLTNVCVNHVFWEEGRTELNCKITEGPLKGVYTTAEEAQDYMQNLQNLQELAGPDSGRVMIYRNYVWGYLAIPGQKVGAPSVWQLDCFSLFDDFLLTKYFELHPEKTPDTIYIDELSNGWTDEWLLQYADENGYQLIQFENGARALKGR